MKTKVYEITGKEKGTIDLPKCFSEKIRADLIAKVLEARKTKQPYAPSLVAGKQYSAKGILVHRRSVWKSQYKKGISRVPRKIFSRRGSQFNWEAAEAPHTRGGMRAHPPKVVSMMNHLKINKKEGQMALISALSATANQKIISERYETLRGKKIENAPFVIESKFSAVKTKDLLAGLKKILGEDLFKVGIKSKAIRSGLGKRRGRKYKSSAGLLFVIGNEEKLKTKEFDVVQTKTLGVTELAKGGPGRLTIYTENAVKELKEKFEGKKK